MDNQFKLEKMQRNAMKLILFAYFSSFIPLMYNQFWLDNAQSRRLMSRINDDVCRRRRIVTHKSAVF